jgi:hypothetical protein
MFHVKHLEFSISSSVLSKNSVQATAPVQCFTWNLPRGGTEHGWLVASADSPNCDQLAHGARVAGASSPPSMEWPLWWMQRSNVSRGTFLAGARSTGGWWPARIPQLRPARARSTGGWCQLPTLVEWSLWWMQRSNVSRGVSTWVIFQRAPVGKSTEQHSECFT